jgi:hypothetical protein
MERIEDVALPLYEGRMIGQFDFSEKGWVSGSGRSAVWEDLSWESKRIGPQYLMAASTYQDEVLDRYLKAVKKQSGDEEREREERRLSDRAELANWWSLRGRRLSFMDVTSATNTRTLIGTITPQYPSGNKVPLLLLGGSRATHLSLSLTVNSFPFDYVMRRRLSGLSVNYFILAEAPLPVASRDGARCRVAVAAALGAPSVTFASLWLLMEEARAKADPWRAKWALTKSERVRCRCISDAVAASRFGADAQAMAQILEGCDLADGEGDADPKGFWRVDKDEDPELRLTVLAQIAFADLQKKIRASGGDNEKGIEAFLTQNDGDGWKLPDELRLADYGLGHDERAKQPQPVASRLGPRFYDWQLGQSAEESWRECEIHAANLGAGMTRDRRLQPAVQTGRHGTPRKAELGLLQEHGDD